MTSDTLRFVLLPGLDGTGHYSRLLEDALSPHGEVTSLSYPCDTPLDYEALAALVASKLPRERHVVVAESFGGPLALMLAARPPPGLAGLVLASTFACIAWPFKRVLLALAERVPPGRVPTVVASRVMWGSLDSASRRSEMRDVMARVDSEVLSLRNCEVLRVDRRAGPRIDLPALVMRGTRDRLIGPRSSATLDHVLAGAERAEFDAPHCLLQSEPGPTSRRIVEFARRRVYDA